MEIKLWNDNVHPYTEKFRGKEISIPAKSFIMMDEDEAEYFKGVFTYPVKDSQGVPDPLYFKMLRIEKDPAKIKVEDPLICHATGQRASSVEELNGILQRFADRLLVDPEAEEAAKKSSKSLKKENEELKLRLKRLEEKIFGESAVI